MIISTVTLRSVVRIDRKDIKRLAVAACLATAAIVGLLQLEHYASQEASILNAPPVQTSSPPSPSTLGDDFLHALKNVHPQRQISIVVSIVPASLTGGYRINSAVTIKVAKDDPMAKLIANGAGIFINRAQPVTVDADYPDDVSSQQPPSPTPSGGDVLSFSDTYIVKENLPGVVVSSSVPLWLQPGDIYLATLKATAGVYFVTSDPPLKTGWSTNEVNLSRSAANVRIAVAPEGSASLAQVCSESTSVVGCLASIANRASNSDGITSSGIENADPEFVHVFHVIGTAVVGGVALCMICLMTPTKKRIRLAFGGIAAVTMASLALQEADLEWGGVALYSISTFGEAAAFVTVAGLPFAAGARTERRSGNKHQIDVIHVLGLTLCAILVSSIGIEVATIVKVQPTAEVVLTTTVTAAAAAAALLVVNVPRMCIAVVSLSLIWAVITWDISVSQFEWVGILATWVVLIVCIVSVTVMASTIVEAFGLRLSAIGFGVFLTAAAILISPPATLLHGKPPSEFRLFSGSLIAIMACILFPIGSIAAARRFGRGCDVYENNAVRLAVFGGFAYGIGYSAGVYWYGNGIYCACLPIALTFSVPRGRARRALQLGSMPEDERRDSLIDLTQRRVLRIYARKSSRNMVKQLFESTATVSSSVDVESRMHDILDVLAAKEDGLVTEQAFAAPPGSTPWKNGIYAAIFTGMLGFPFFWYVSLTYPLRIFWSSDFSGLGFSSFVSYAGYFQTAFLGFIYGYYYPQLPGASPLAKSGRYALIMLGPTLTYGWFAFSARARLETLALDASQFVIAMILLGIAWEAYAMRCVNLPWTLVHNFRSVRTLAAPATSIVAAAVTAAIPTFIK